LAAHVPFELAATLLAQLTGLTLGSSTVERAAVAVGTALQRVLPTHGGNGVSSPPRAPTRLYLSLDGTLTPLREAWKKDGSRGRLQCRWGECKVAIAYEAGVGEHGDERVVWRDFAATLGDVTAFTPRVFALARRSGAHRTQELVLLGDGAVWIWHLGAALFPEALQILDYWHMTQHLYAVAAVRYPGNSADQRAWVHTCQAALEQDAVEHVLLAIGNWEPETAAAREVQAREYGYFERNQERMRYGSFRQAGYQVGSGVMEASCRQVVAQRLHEAGMHWREETAEAVVTLRAALLSSNPPDLRQYCGAQAA
jgi:hypothetical protein